MSHISLDLETLDTDSNAIILSIGAVRFDFNNDRTENFYITPDRVEQAALGGAFSHATRDWWNMQTREAREAAFNGPQTPVDMALGAFAAWVNAPGEQLEGMWGNGSDFDNVILGNLYRAIGKPLPWSFGKNRCFRTIKNLKLPKEVVLPVREGEHHNALDDAKYQAQYLKAVVKALNIRF